MHFHDGWLRQEYRHTHTHTHTHTHMIFYTAFPRQQYLHETSSVLCYTYIAMYGPGWQDFRLLEATFGDRPTWCGQAGQETNGPPTFLAVLNTLWRPLTPHTAWKSQSLPLYLNKTGTTRQALTPWDKECWIFQILLKLRKCIPFWQNLVKGKIY
jgi:hypothetical protein